jgi:hypothetical protein
MRRTARAIGLVGAAFGCAPPGGAVPDPCHLVTYALDAGASARDLAGAFAVTLVAASGDSAGRTTTGRLDLSPGSRPDAVLIGAADLAVESVGAVRLGDLAASADSAPGVLVMQSGGDRPTILLRLGSEANAVGVIRFDGGYTVLEVLRIDENGFAGSWRSGVTSNTATGHFCAQRIESPNP